MNKCKTHSGKFLFGHGDSHTIHLITKKRSI